MSFEGANYNLESARESLESAEVLHLMPTNYSLSAQKRLSVADNIIKLSCGFSTKNEVEMSFNAQESILDRKADGEITDSLRKTESAESRNIKVMQRLK